MFIDENKDQIIFDHLVSVSREFGSDDPLTSPAAKAVAKNAKGVFKDRTLIEIHSNSMAAALRLKDMLTNCK